MTADSIQTQATHRMRQHVMRGTMKGRNYAPDTTYEQLKLGHAGPHSLRIGEILQHWADMWAQDLRESNAKQLDIDVEQLWRECMRNADAEIDRYLASNHRVRAA